MSHIAETYLKDAEQVHRALPVVCERLQEAIYNARTTKTALKEAEDALKEGENALAAELAIQAMSKAGPLAGIATSSKTYQTITDAELARARAGQLSPLDIAVKRAAAEAERAAIELEQAQAQFSAVRHDADLLKAMLEATRL